MDRLASLLAVLLVALAPAACRRLPPGDGPRPPPGPDVPTTAWYEAPGPVPRPLSVERLWTKPRSEFLRVLLPPRVPRDLAHVPRVEDPIEILHMRPRPAGTARRPLIVMFPILGNGTLLMCEFASGFVAQGYDVAIVPRKKLEFDPVRSVDQAEDELRTLVMRGRQATDWLVLQPGVDATRLGVCGVSAGGILGACLAGADARFTAGVFILAGGPMADVMVETVEGEFADNIPRVQEARGWTREEVRHHLRGVIRTDPVALAARIPRHQSMMIIALDDDSVPTHLQLGLWEALGRPEAHTLPTGHYTSFAFFFPQILLWSQRFLGSRLGPP